MLKNYIKIAFRNLRKERSYTVINVLGLAVGMGVCLFLFLLDQYAVQMDKYHANVDRMYRVNSVVKTSSGSNVDAAITPFPWGSVLEGEFSQIEEVVRFVNRSYTVRHGEKVFTESIRHVDPSIFDVFSYHLKYGNPETVFNNPRSLILTESTAKRYFNQTNITGRTLSVDGEEFEITGVLYDLPEQSSFNFNMLAPTSYLNASNYDTYENWRTHNIYTYVLLQQGADPQAVNAGFNEFVSTYISPEDVDKYSPYLQPFGEMFLYSDKFGEHGDTLNVMYIYIFSAIGFLILLIACINFINLATARAINRALEVGIRKTMGAVRRQIVVQFLLETLFLTLSASLLALMFVDFALPWFNQLSGWSVEANLLKNAGYLSAMVGVILLVTILAGAYPAFYLSRFEPSQVLKSQQSGSHKSRLRTFLVVTQFAFAVFLMICSFIMYDQLQYLQNKDRGYDAKQVISVGIPQEASLSTRETMRTEFLRDPRVSNASMASRTPATCCSSTRVYPEQVTSENGVIANDMSIDSRYLDLFDIPVVKGRNFDPNIAGDSTGAMLINETAATQFGWENPIGKIIERRPTDGSSKSYRVIGVVQDFHHDNLYNRIQPLIIQYQKADFSSLIVQYTSVDNDEMKQWLNDKWSAFFPAKPVNYSFVEQEISDAHELEGIIADMLIKCTILAIFVACLGLLGISSYTILRRRKEIGIRKVMGATMTDIVRMLSGKFLKLVVISFVLAAPFSWYGMSQWLSTFAYHTEIHIMVFILSGLATMAIAWVTVAWQTVSAARLNPVETLHSE